jgi:hypothetical protein
MVPFQCSVIGAEEKQVDRHLGLWCAEYGIPVSYRLGVLSRGTRTLLGNNGNSVEQPGLQRTIGTFRGKRTLISSSLGTISCRLAN